MKTAFADTGYWIALLYPADALHALAQSLHRAIETQPFQIVTSEMVLTELINFFSKRGSQLRQQSVAFVVQIQR